MIHISYKKIIVLALVVGSLVSFSSGTTVSASTFNPGRIIDDGVFTDKSTMNPSQIQDFLNAKVPRCDTWGEQPYAGTTRAQYAASRGVSTPFTCLKDYTQDGKRASQIIYDVAQKYSINPQVLIVLLQKEQGLITDDWPWPIQYRSATGYGCPDTADCSAQYYGFTNQVDWAARMFRAILNDSPDWYTPYELGNNFIQYSPNASCGGSTVNIQNRSTQALYNYTPYQPNQAALDAGWGTAPCGAYGNRNFHLYFTSWFGSTFVQFTSLDTPRWMQLAVTTQKVNPWTGDNLGDGIAAGTQLQFIDKIYVGGQWYLRTAYDSANNLLKGIPQSRVTEIQFEGFSEPRYLMLTKDARKVDPRSFRAVSAEVFPTGTSVRFASKIMVNGQWFYRTEYDTQNNHLRGFYATSVSDITFEPFDTPRIMEIRGASKLINLRDQTTVTTTAPSTLTQAKFTDKVYLNGQWFFRTEIDASNGEALAFTANSVDELNFNNMATAYSIQMTVASQKYSLLDESPLTAETLQDGQIITVVGVLEVNGEKYYQTVFDRENDLKHGIKVGETKPHLLKFIPLSDPRNITFSETSQKTNLMDGGLIGEQFTAGSSLLFSTKTQIAGDWYLRTKFDSDNKLLYGVPISKLNIQ